MSGQYKKQSLVVLCGDQGGRTFLWVGKVFLLMFLLSPIRNWDIEQLEYVQFMKVTKDISVVDRALGWVCLRWATGG